MNDRFALLPMVLDHDADPRVRHHVRRGLAGIGSVDPADTDDGR